MCVCVLCVIKHRRNLEKQKDIVKNSFCTKKIVGYNWHTIAGRFTHSRHINSLCSISRNIY